MNSSRAINDLRDVQVFQKVDYDPTAVNLVRATLQIPDPLQLQAFFKRSLQIVSKPDGEISDILIQEDKHLDENTFMDAQVMIESAQTMRVNYDVDTLKIYESQLELSEAKYRKAVADKLLQAMFATKKIKAALKQNATAKRLRQVVQTRIDQEKYVTRVDEQQQMRSTSSRDDDPILPENANEAVRMVSR